MACWIAWITHFDIWDSEAVYLFFEMMGGQAGRPAGVWVGQLAPEGSM